MDSGVRKSVTVLTSSTIAFVTCFMIWMVFAVLGIPIKEQLHLNETEFGLLTAMPVLSGSLIRVPLGIWADRFGGRIVFFLLMLVCVPAVWLLEYAHTYSQFLWIALWLGLVGGSFSVGTPYVAKWFRKERQGMAMGIFGAGNAGAALNKFLAPALMAAYSWQAVPRVYAVVLLVIAVLFWFFSYPEPKAANVKQPSLKAQLLLMKNPQVLKYSQLYSVVFGGYVGISLWMVS
ncbi:MAG: NarK/NasA family nitrate transporter, partial [Snodgrassella sp.]|nr:NarK/NasA family nitrate transporter [Snodgrassella sp.]